MILDDTKGFSYEHSAFDYDFKTTNQLMLDHQLPHQYANTLVSGLWDNCEILPEKESAAQGKALAFGQLAF